MSTESPSRLISEKDFFSMKSAVDALRSIAKRKSTRGCLVLPILDVRTAAGIAQAALDQVEPVFERIVQAEPAEVPAVAPPLDPRMKALAEANELVRASRAAREQRTLRFETISAVSDNSTDVDAPEIRAAWDKYRGGADLPMSDAFLFAAGYVAAVTNMAALHWPPTVPWEQLTVYTRDGNKTVALETEVKHWRERDQLAAKRFEMPADIKAIFDAVVALRIDERMSIEQRVPYLAGVYRAAREVSVFAFKAGVSLTPVPVAPVRKNESSLAAITFALTTESPMEFLRCWNNGEFDAIRREWPDAPETVFIGSDPMHPATAAQIAPTPISLPEPRLNEIWQEVERQWAAGAADPAVNRHVLYGRAIEQELAGLVRA